MTLIKKKYKLKAKLLNKIIVKEFLIIKVIILKKNNLVKEFKKTNKNCLYKVVK